MNILIVNAFGTSPKALNKFQKFYQMIDKILKKVSFKSGIENFLYTIRTVNALDDIVYSLPSNHQASEEKKSEFKKNFDKIDMIFIDGRERNYLPWEKQGFKLFSLIQLCQKGEKNVFAAGVGILHLIYLLATGGKLKNIINSNGELPTIENLEQIPFEFIKKLKRDDGFLDYVTGDVYEKNYSNEWEPIMNIGIHKLLYAEKFYNRGKFVLKDYKMSKRTDLISSNKKEIKIKSLKQFILHWLLKGIPTEFVSYTSLTWYLHNFCLKTHALQYKVLCDSNFGPMVVEYKNTIGVMFHIKENYLVSMKILENFISKKFIDVQTKTTLIFETKKYNSQEAEKLFKSVVKDIPEDESETQFNQLETLTKLRPHSKTALVNTSRLFNSMYKRESEGDHVGFSINNRKMLYVENNAVIQNKIPIYSNNISSMPSYSSSSKTRLEKVNDSDVFPESNWDDEQLIAFYKDKGRKICQNLQEAKDTYESQIHKISKGILTHRPKTSKSSYSRKSSHPHSTVSKKSNPHPQPQPQPQPRKEIIMPPEGESVITMLFPYIREDDFKMKDVNTRQKGSENKERIRLNQETRIRSNFNKKFRKYDKELNTFADKPSIRCSSAYITDEEAKRREFIESKKHWMCNEDFKKVFGKLTSAQRMKEELSKESEYNQGNVTPPANAHQFRTVDKTKWVSPKNFIV